MNLAEIQQFFDARLERLKHWISGLTGGFDTYALRTRLRRRVRAIAGSLDFRAWPRELHYYVQIPAEPGRLREILQGDPLVYPFRFPLARIVAELEPGGGAAAGSQLHFVVRAFSPLSGLVAIRLHRRRIEQRLEELANHLYFRCLAAPLLPPDWDPGLLETSDFPSLDRSNFRQPGAGVREHKNRILGWLDAPVDYPARNYFFHYQLQPGHPQNVDLGEVLLIKLPMPQAELHSLLPPPFHPGTFVDAGLLLIVARELGLSKPNGASRQPAIRWEVRAPVELITRQNHLQGWLPLEACRVPLDRPGLPFDTVSASLRRTPEGLRFCAGSQGGRLSYHCVYRPRRGLRTGDRFPDPLNGESRIFVQNPDDLNITVLTERADFAVNRVEHALDETATYEHHHRQARLPTHAAFYGERWGLNLEIPPEAFYLRRLRLELQYDFNTQLRDTNYRPYPARVGDPARV